MERVLAIGLVAWEFPGLLISRDQPPGTISAPSEAGGRAR